MLVRHQLNPDPAVSTRADGCGSISEEAAPVRGDVF
jgi:hypothetical protein